MKKASPAAQRQAEARTSPGSRTRPATSSASSTRRDGRAFAIHLPATRGGRPAREGSTPGGEYQISTRLPTVWGSWVGSIRSALASPPCGEVIHLPATRGGRPAREASTPGGD